MSDLENKIEQLLKEVRELKENQKEMTEKMSKMQQVIDHIEDDIYEEEGFDFSNLKNSRLEKQIGLARNI